MSPRKHFGNTRERTFVYTRSMPRRIYDWLEIQRYHDQGHGFVACQQRFGFTHTAWVKAIKRGQLRSSTTPFRDRRRKYDWSEVQRYYDEGKSYRDCQARFGFSAQAWQTAVRRGEVKPRRNRLSLEHLLLPSTGRAVVRRRLLADRILENRCSICGISEWCGAPLTLHIDHINGIRNDHRLANLRMLCPNCHSQTPTYGGRNVKRLRSLQDTGPNV